MKDLKYKKVIPNYDLKWHSKRIYFKHEKRMTRRTSKFVADKRSFNSQLKKLISTTCFRLISFRLCYLVRNMIVLKMKLMSILRF